MLIATGPYTQSKERERDGHVSHAVRVRADIVLPFHIARTATTQSRGRVFFIHASYKPEEANIPRPRTLSILQNLR